MKKNNLLLITIASFLLLPVIGQASTILGYLVYRNKKRKEKDRRE